MKSNLGKKARLLALLVLVAVLPLGIGACGDGGDSEGGPTGPSTKYNPDIDYPGATITAVVDDSSPDAGHTFTISTTFKDANGLPVEGVPLYVVAESGGASGYFSYQTNPTLTDRNGRASIGVLVSVGCPGGSYTFTIYSVRAAQARGYVGVEVAGSNLEVISKPNVDGPISVSSGQFYDWYASASVSSFGHALEYRFDWGNSTASGWITADAANQGSSSTSYTLACPAADQTFEIRVQARCASDTSAVSEYSDPLTVTVTCP